MSTPPGWYKDPEQPRRARYWDGDHFVGSARRRPTGRGWAASRQVVTRCGFTVAAAIAVVVLVLAALS